MLGSAVAQFNGMIFEYLPLVTLLGALTGVGALGAKVWAVLVEREQRIRDRAVAHKRIELDRRISERGRRETDK